MREPALHPTVDPIDRAHLTGWSRPSPPIHRYAPSPDLTALVQRYWVPVWSVPRPQTQRTLQHPVCLLVVSGSYARFYGVTRGLSAVALAGEGWAVGTMLTPAAGRLLLRASVATLTDRFVDLGDMAGLDGPRLTDDVRAAMTPSPGSPESHRTAIGHLEDRLQRYLPVDERGLLVNRVVAWLETHPEVGRVADLATAFDLTERSLQRLVEDRLGLTPKWLIQRRRLHDAVVRLKAGVTSLSDLAADLGYADQAHFTHDFKLITAMTPGEFLADQPVG
jgi:AraC-like DNA-binding protein